MTQPSTRDAFGNRVGQLAGDPATAGGAAPAVRGSRARQESAPEAPAERDAHGNRRGTALPTEAPQPIRIADLPTLRPARRRSVFSLAVTGLLLVVASAAVAVSWFTTRIDPHFKAARTLVEGYELTRPAEVRNYSADIYTAALFELDLVDPDSDSAEPAARLRRRIERGRSELERVIESRLETQASQLEIRRARTAMIEDRREFSKIAPPRDYKECEQGDGAARRETP